MNTKISFNTLRTRITCKNNYISIQKRLLRKDSSSKIRRKNPPWRLATQRWLLFLRRERESHPLSWICGRRPMALGANSSGEWMLSDIERGDILFVLLYQENSFIYFLSPASHAP
ncbi:hypothetical protein CEXT_80581 [Caerostris extrusa]|uniref:Uncharacterized protein n=1 Tax=Caerostris extrusa TaxID=172846 RepID=A0AAV4THX1_CAEEX|nr:hypothetical protein CEXT_80581 [Caerostris extrusa]